MVTEVIYCRHCGRVATAEATISSRTASPPITASRGTPLPRLRASEPPRPFSQRLHRGAQGRDPASLPGAFKPARAQAHLRRLAHHRHKLAQKKVEPLDLKDTLVLPDAVGTPRGHQHQVLE